MAVINFDITNRFPYANGRKFGDCGSYEQVDGILTYEVDPSHEANKFIVDLPLAKKNSDGNVSFTSDFTVIKPVETYRGANRVLVELPNRGRKRVVDTLNRTGKDASGSPDPGDGFLFERGVTVASLGWQWDVYGSEVLMGLNPPIADFSGESNAGKTVVEIRPNYQAKTWLLADRVHKPLRVKDVYDQDASFYIKDFEDAEDVLIPRDKWSFSKETSDGVVPSDEHVYLEGGFLPGKYYQIVYETKDSPIAGSGLLALRDATSFLKYDASTLFNGVGRLDSAIGYGVSQTGRMLRHFLYLGLNVDESGRKVFDGLLPHVAGGRVGAFNHRFAQPSNQSYPGFGHMFPFHDIELTDPFTGLRDGLLKRLNKSEHRPKVIYTNSSAEYWRGDGSLMHTDPMGENDVAHDSDYVRVYHFAGTQHGAGVMPQSNEPGAEGAFPLYAPNVIDYSPLLRAAFANLEKWVSDGVPPPESRHPRIDDGTAVSRDNVLDAFDALPKQVTPDRSKLWVLRAMNLGERSSEGIGEYPTAEGDRYVCFVSAVDLDGNEVGGIRLPDLSQAVATHAGWNVRHPSTGAPDQQIPMIGFSRWFPKTETERENMDDPRVSITERYKDRDEYVDLVTRDAERLAKDGYILTQDIEMVVRNAVDRYDSVTSA